MSEPDLSRLVAHAREAWREGRLGQRSEEPTRRPKGVVLGLFMLISAGTSYAPQHEREHAASLSRPQIGSETPDQERGPMRCGLEGGALLGALASVAMNCSAPANELLVNGDFETVASQSCGWICISTGSNELPGWDIVQNTIDRQRTVPPTCMPEGWLAYDGEFSIDLNGCSTAGAIQQTVAVSPGASYELRFALTVNPGADGIPSEGRLRISINHSSYDFVAPRTSAPFQTWMAHAITFTPTTGTVTIKFTSLNDESPSSWAGPVIDAVSLTETCPADVIQNGVVDAIDLSAVLSSWGTDGGKYPRADVDANGAVDAIDLAMVLSSWGACP